MTVEQLRQASRAEPFVPFVVALADGRRLSIPHPECILIPPGTGRTFVVAERGEDYCIIDLLRVISIEFLSQA